VISATSTSGIHEGLAGASRTNNGDVLVKLDTTQSAQLASLENRIEQGLASFIEVGEALSAIRESKLYRATHGTFEEYCREKWSMSRFYVNLTIRASDTVKTLPAKMVTMVTSERQARELSRVEPARRVEVIERAQVATGGKITAAAIKEAAVEVVEAPAKRERFVMPNLGLFIARGVISHLGQILPKDGEKYEALELVITWCRNEQISAQRSTSITPSATKASCISEANQLWNVAKGRLDNIRKNDPERVAILREAIAYAQKRIEDKK
jgi:hypothetical protein